MIPKQLQKSEFRFCLIRPKTKRPFEKDWANKGYQFDDLRLTNHIENGGNYGVIGGYGRLRILDIDDKELAKEFEKKLTTLTVKTGSGGRHFYFLSDYETNHVLINELGELRSNNYQCVGPNCIHPSGNKYIIVDESDILDLPKEIIEDLINPYLREEQETKTDTSVSTGKDTSGSGLEYRRVLAMIREGKSRKVIYKEMENYKKWSNSKDDYKNITFNKARDYSLLEKEKVIEPKELTEKEIEETKQILGETFEKIKDVLKTYIKLKEDYYDLVAIWIIGTYCIKSFETYPYLFINAQKGSGKTRLLKLIESLANNGELLASMREAVLFRIATDDKTILIDELEGLDRKENAPLKELLNACYKRGTKVYRMRKKGEEYVAEAFYPFTPIAIANISGLDDVLEDRCIAIRLDKSSKSSYSLLQEDFKTSPIIKQIKSTFEEFSVVWCRLCMSVYTQKTWNSYIKLVYNNTTYNTHTTLTTSFERENEDFSSVESVYKKIIDSGISGRHLELVFPLLIVSLMINKKTFENVLKISKSLAEKKKDDDVMESKDVSLIEFVSKMKSEIEYDQFRFVHELSEKFRFFLGIRKEREQEDINPLWIGRALKRLGLVVDKRRLSSGVEVKLNIPKAIKMLENFN